MKFLLCIQANALNGKRDDIDKLIDNELGASATLPAIYTIQLTVIVHHENLTIIDKSVVSGDLNPSVITYK